MAKNMEEHWHASNWQELLAKILRDAKQKKKLAVATGLNPATLVRWTNGTSHPREGNLERLIAALPRSARQTFIQLIQQDFPGIVLVEQAKIHRVWSELPPEFYARVLGAYGQLPQPLCRQAIQDLILQQAIELLDPQRHGMSLTIATCVRPLNGYMVRSLREIAGIGTFPWKRDLTQSTMALGAESLAGYALRQVHPVVVFDRSTPTLFPVHWTDHEQSVAAVSIVCHGMLCGCLIAASAVPGYFHEERLVHLLEEYAHLAVLLFEEHEFYTLNDINLYFMPPYEIQQPYFRQFNKFVSQQFRLAQVRGTNCTLEQARHQAWRDIEEALIQAFLNTTIL